MIRPRGKNWGSTPGGRCSVARAHQVRTQGLRDRGVSAFRCLRPRWATRSRCRRSLTVFLLTCALLFGLVAVAEADEFVVFSDPGLRAAVVGQLVTQGQVPPGSDGTTITPSDMQTITALAAPNQGIVRLGGLETAVNLTSLVLCGNRIADISPLTGLASLRQLDLSGNDLDLAPGSPATSIIATLEGSGAHVSHGAQRVCLLAPAFSSSASTYRSLVTFSTSISPRGAGLSGATKLLLYHLEAEVVTERVKGKKKRFAVNYWRLRRTLIMRSGPATGLSARTRLPYAGKWQARAVYAGAPDYVACGSASSLFTVHDPRIQAAIGWALRRRGSHDWDHYCLRFVCASYMSGAHATVRRYETARQAARALRASAHRSINAPRGAWVFYDSTPLGHVGISLGNGTMISDYGGAGVKVLRITQGGHYVGWAAPPLSPPIRDWAQPTAR